MLTKSKLILMDAALTFIAVVIGLILRLEILYVGYFFHTIWPFTLSAVILRPLILHFLGIYKYIWRYAKTREYLNLVFAVFLGSIVLTPLTLFLLYPCCMESFPRSMLGLEGIISLLLFGSVRVALKNFEQYPGDHYNPKTAGNQTQNALIIGAGSAGSLIVQELRANPQLGLTPVAFLDDDPQKIGRTVLLLPVFGPGERLPEVVNRLKIDVVVIAIPTAPGEVIRKFVQLCEQVGVPSKIVPGLYEIISGRVSISRLRPINVGDLLRREAVHVDSAQICNFVRDKTILVTGAGGSIGSELCSQILSCHPSQLIAIGHGENSLYGLLDYISVQFKDPQNLVVQIADIRDQHRMQSIFQRYPPEIIFHAAAHKHVPLMEDNLEDAVTNNILGTWNLVQLAIQYEVSNFVLISTDKAVQPVNVMGMTKNIAEHIIRLAAAHTGRPYVSVRFGNVLGSRGSVIHRFQRQIAAGGPVTITHPDMERYFMTIPEAVQLVLQAAVFGNDGETFVLDMGDPVKISELAQEMIKLPGYQVGRDIEIQYTGLRPGERLSERLFNQHEAIGHTEHPKILVTHTEPGMTLQAFAQEIQTLEELARSGQTAALHQRLEQLTNQPDTAG